MCILDNMNKEKLYNLLVKHITNEWKRAVSKDAEYENQINNQSNNEYDQIRNKGRINELNDLIEFIEKIEQTLI